MSLRAEKALKIGNRLVGKGQPCYIIAEAGVNHNGDVARAKKLIDAAVKADADAVKFQTFNSDELVTISAEKAGYQKKTTGAKEKQLNMLRKLELSPSDFKKLSQYAKVKGITFLSTPFDNSSADLLEKLGVPAYKIPSGEITNCSLLARVARKNKPIIVSTGMSSLKEIREAVHIVQREGTGEIALLHCVSGYPTRPEDVNLKVMATLRRAFGLPVGFSDHTTGISVPIAAVALGACIIEKHFTLDKNLPGPDHRASLEPGELAEMVKAIREVEKALGDGRKRLTPEEKANQKAARRSLVAAKDIKAGKVITADMICIKRPGTGLEPKDIDFVIGKKAKKTIAAGEVIHRADV
ncbi:MAG TPA: N-acetylneuraminate synthase [Dehalococcoidales bacterium]|nr:N-acetylneuraminate synthase [Dehalococcoidales bacterium]